MRGGLGGMEEVVLAPPGSSGSFQISPANKVEAFHWVGNVTSFSTLYKGHGGLW